MELLAVLLLGAGFLLTRVTKLRTAINILLAQSMVITLACLVVGIKTGEVHMYFAAFLTAITKVVIIPYALYRVVSRLQGEREVNPIISPQNSSLAAVFVIVLSYGVVDHALPGIVSRDVLAAAIALNLIGLLLITTRRQAILQIVGLITVENGLYLLGLSVTKGLPLIIEMGIFIDVLVAVLILVLLTYRLKISFMSTDTSVLKKLKG